MTVRDGSEPMSSASSSMSEAAFTRDMDAWLDRAEAMPSVTVVICAYTEKRWPQIVGAHGSLLIQQAPADQIVVVIDHNDGLLDRARTAFPEATVVPNSGPRGLSGARNTGVAHAKGDIIAFLDDDAEAEPDWLARMLPHYRNSSVLGVGGHAIPAWESARPRWMPPEFDWVVGCSFTGQPSRLSPVRNIIGCNMSFRRTVLERINGFDSALGRVGAVPVGCEETELCIRIQQDSPDGVILYEPHARVRHHVPADRATWRYFRRRCFSEGRSKAVVTRLVGSDAALSTEREYTRRALPAGIWRGLQDLGERDLSGAFRSAAIVAGLFITASGYASAHARRVSRVASASTGLRSSDEPRPVRVLSVELSEGVPAVSDRNCSDNDRYGAAQVLVRLHGQPIGVLDIELPRGGLTAEAHARQIVDRLSKEIDGHLVADGLPRLDSLTLKASEQNESCRAGRPPASVPFVSVVVPTSGRTLKLERALDSLAALDYPRFEIIVVDNAPAVESTARLVASRAATDSRVRYTAEPRAGVAHARNRGLVVAHGDIVAFADDDVIVDGPWLQALVDGFADNDTAAVTGQVLASELETPAQVWIEQYGGFSKGVGRKRFDRLGVTTFEGGEARSQPAARLYPYLPGAYGSGANMAFRTSYLRELGGFDPRLVTGEDIDTLMRVVLSGKALVYEPAAVVWHAHHRDMKALRRLMFRYGIGLSGVMTKCLVNDDAGRRELLRRLPSGVAFALNPHSQKNDRKKDSYPSTLTALELFGMALGPAYYAARAWSERSGRNGL
jgi:O-antigen biosynthesis protein